MFWITTRFSRRLVGKKRKVWGRDVSPRSATTDYISKKKKKYSKICLRMTQMSPDKTGRKSQTKPKNIMSDPFGILSVRVMTTKRSRLRAKCAKIFSCYVLSLLGKSYAFVKSKNSSRSLCGLKTAHTTQIA